VPGDTSLNDRHNGRFAPVNLADEINLDSKPEDIDLAIHTAERFNQERDAGIYHLLGVNPPGVVLNNHNARVNSYWAEPERLLNSRSGRIHLFPCVPDSATVAIKDFQAQKGFLVSAECRNGEITYVHITARRDVKCSMANPWPGHMVTVIRERDNTPVNTGPDPAYESNGFAFQALQGESYLVAKAQ
jgi:hypothetical protein